MGRCGLGLGWDRPATCLTLVTLSTPTSRPARAVSRQRLILRAAAAVRNQPPAATDRLQHLGGRDAGRLRQLSPSRLPHLSGRPEEAAREDPPEPEPRRQGFGRRRAE